MNGFRFLSLARSWDAALALRPLTGSEAEIEAILPELEAEPVSYASFDAPNTERTGGRDAAQLLRDALRLSLRRGAGPFRSAGRINFEPRAYQLAPLMMALRLETIRLLIADDVGIGKTDRSRIDPARDARPRRDWSFHGPVPAASGGVASLWRTCLRCRFP